jgi:hypothetical protein
VIKPKRLFRARRPTRPPARPPVDHGQRFNAAMKLIEVEDFIRGPDQCSLCGETTPNRALRVETRAEGSVQFVLLSLCPACHADGGIARLDAILDQEQRP